MRINSSFGHFFSVQEHENMYKVNSCDTQTAFSFGFEFAPGRNFDDYSAYG